MSFYPNEFHAGVAGAFSGAHRSMPSDFDSYVFFSSQLGTDYAPHSYLMRDTVEILDAVRDVRSVSDILRSRVLRNGAIRGCAFADLLHTLVENPVNPTEREISMTGRTGWATGAEPCPLSTWEPSRHRSFALPQPSSLAASVCTMEAIHHGSEPGSIEVLLRTSLDTGGTSDRPE